ncbi:MAG: ethanolamine ammonia-lyase reactivating factor EutA, partial [Alphaproteobacteria bacterium]|nr:ethanolamine ammonia-lyase reactivating factor EutA [Alphaproteobacteria bacterium]
MTIETDDEGGRVFFSSAGRSLEGEDEICLLSVGVDIGSSTSHLVFSRIVLERLDSRYVVTERDTFYQSDILLTPYAAGDTIDADALGTFFEKQYENAMVDPDEIDAGALILTGVAVRRANARRIGELFARQAGRLVAVSAGDGLETVMAAYGSGAVARSTRDGGAAVMNVDVGGGTAKIAVCHNGAVTAITAVDVGARLVCTDAEGRITRLEEAGRRIGADLGLSLDIGDRLTPAEAGRLATRMADALFEAMGGGAPRVGTTGLLRLDPLVAAGPPATVTFSGGDFRIFPRLGERRVRRPRPSAGGRDRPPHRGGRDADRASRPGHPRHRGRRLAIRHAGERQHHLRAAPLCTALAQPAGHRPAFALKGEHRHRQRGGRGRHPRDLAALRPDGIPGGDFRVVDGPATFHRLDAFLPRRSGRARRPVHPRPPHCAGRR